MAHCPLSQITTADGEICRFDRKSSGRDINIFWIWIVDTCGYLCESGVVTITYWRLFGFTVRTRPSRPLQGL